MSRRIKSQCQSSFERWKDAEDTYEEAKFGWENCFEGCVDRQNGNARGCKTRCEHQSERWRQAARRVDQSHDDFLACQEGKQTDRASRRRSAKTKKRGSCGCGR